MLEITVKICYHSLHDFMIIHGLAKGEAVEIKINVWVSKWFISIEYITYITTLLKALLERTEYYTSRWLEFITKNGCKKQVK